MKIHYFKFVPKSNTGFFWEGGKGKFLSVSRGWLFFLFPNFLTATSSKTWGTKLSNDGNWNARFKAASTNICVLLILNEVFVFSFHLIVTRQYLIVLGTAKTVLNPVPLLSRWN